MTRCWCLVAILKLVLGWDYKEEIWSRFLFELVMWPLGYFPKMNSTLGSVVPLAMFFQIQVPVMGELSQGGCLWWETPLLHFSPMDTRHKRVTCIPVINAREEDWDGSTLCYSFCFDLDITWSVVGNIKEVENRNFQTLWELKIQINRHCGSWK